MTVFVPMKNNCIVSGANFFWAGAVGVTLATGAGAGAGAGAGVVTGADLTAAVSDIIIGLYKAQRKYSRRSYTRTGEKHTKKHL